MYLEYFFISFTARYIFLLTVVRLIILIKLGREPLGIGSRTWGHWVDNLRALGREPGGNGSRTWGQVRLRTWGQVRLRTWGLSYEGQVGLKGSCPGLPSGRFSQEPGAGQVENLGQVRLRTWGRLGREPGGSSVKVRQEWKAHVIYLYMIIQDICYHRNYVTQEKSSPGYMLLGEHNSQE